MGLIDRLMGKGQDEGDEMFDDDFDEEWEEDWEEEDEDEEMAEWDTHYDFLDSALGNSGFAGVQEFMNKAMVYKINNSVKYRDRVKIGNETMTLVRDTVETSRGMTGESSTSDWGEAAEKLKDANEFKEQIDSMIDKEEIMVNRLMNLGQETLDVVKDRYSSGDSSVSTSVRESDREI